MATHLDYDLKSGSTLEDLQLQRTVAGRHLPLVTVARGEGTVPARSLSPEGKTPARGLAFVLRLVPKFWLRGQDLNLRPLGYEPNELPDCSTSRLSLASIAEQAASSERHRPADCRRLAGTRASFWKPITRAARDLAACGVEEDRSGRPEQAESGCSSVAVLGAVRGDVGLQQHGAGEAGAAPPDRRR